MDAETMLAKAPEEYKKRVLGGATAAQQPPQTASLPV